MAEKAFLYFFRRFMSILEGIYGNPKKLAAFILLILVSAILSFWEYRKDRREGPIGGKVLSNALWLSIGLGLPIACAMGCVGYVLGILGMERIGRSISSLGKYAFAPFKFHIVMKHHVKTDWTTTLWVVVGCCASAFEAFLGLFYCLSLIGIPFGIKHLKIAIPIWTPYRFRVFSDLELEEQMETSRDGR